MSTPSVDRASPRREKKLPNSPARSAVIILAITWVIFDAARPVLLGDVRFRIATALLRNLIGVSPIVTLLVVTLLRPDVTHRVDWFLPLLFAAGAATGTIATAMGFQMTTFLLTRALPELILAAPLWSLRPKASRSAEITE